MLGCWGAGNRRSVIAISRFRHSHQHTTWGWRKLRDIYNKHENHLILTPLAINRYRQRTTAELAARMQSELGDDMQSTLAWIHQLHSGTLAVTKKMERHI